LVLNDQLNLLRAVFILLTVLLIEL
jgi:hypothetical protein